MCVPLFYYGLQVVCGLLTPGYSFLSQAASELGSDLAAHPRWFNIGIMAQAVLTLVAAAAASLTLVRLRRHWVFAALTAIVLGMNAVQSFWAGWFPMPDPRHGGHPAFVAFMLAVAPVLLVSVWPYSSRGMRVYFLATLLLLLVMVPFMARLLPLDTTAYRGLLQRVFTLAVFVPIGAASLVLARALSRRSAAAPPHA